MGKVQVVVSGKDDNGVSGDSDVEVMLVVMSGDEGRIVKAAMVSVMGKLMGESGDDGDDDDSVIPPGRSSSLPHLLLNPRPRPKSTSYF